MADETLPTSSLLPIGPSTHEVPPQPPEDREDWDVVHVGTADAPDHGAKAVMRTSDGDFRISAAEVDGKVGLMIEKYHPHDSAEDADESEELDQLDELDEHDEEDSEDEDEDEDEVEDEDE